MKLVDKIWFSLKEKIGATEFLGYEHEKVRSHCFIFNKKRKRS